MVNQHKNSYHGQSVTISETLIFKSLKSTRQLVFKCDPRQPSMILLQRTAWLLHLPICMLFGLSKPRTRFLHPFWIILGHLRVPRCLSGPIQGKLTHGGSPGGVVFCQLRGLWFLHGVALSQFYENPARHQPPEYNARYLPPRLVFKCDPRQPSMILPFFLV